MDATGGAEFSAWLETTLGHAPVDLGLFARALTHSSHTDPDYERLEFLGDRVLGLGIADWLYAQFPEEAEGSLSRRLNALVTREVCAEIAREIGVSAQLRLGRQARDDGATDSGNVLGDVVEALIGALYLEAGFAASTDFIRRAWGERVRTQRQAPQHPKSALQEWAAGAGARPPVYSLVGRAGPHHAPRFTVAVEIAGRGRAEAEGTSKHEAETAAARMLLEQLG